MPQDQHRQQDPTQQYPQPEYPEQDQHDTVSSFGGTSPMGRPAQPAELAPTFVFLASQEASYVNGETLGVTGGQPLP
jgi:NAD(P)-dependent dehydrogenase (short-subunit alcohol dehydrogenase family)